MILTNHLGWFSLEIHSELLVLGWTDLFEQDLFDLKREASYFWQFQMTDPLKNQHVSQKETISKGNFLFQPSIFQKVSHFSDDLRAEKSKTPSDGVFLFV